MKQHVVLHQEQPRTVLFTISLDYIYGLHRVIDCYHLQACNCVLWCLHDGGISEQWLRNK
jgi:hypothetical protein